VAELNLKKAEKMKDELTKKQQIKIRNLYKEAAREVGKEARALKNIKSGSKVIERARLYDLERKIRKQIKIISWEIETGIKSDMYGLSRVIAEENEGFINKIGIKETGLFSGVPDSVVKAISSGKVYNSGWSLSSRIWSIEEKTLKDIHSVIAKGLIENKSSYDIAKDLEKYVDPKAKKDWSWSKVYPNTNKVVDFNAQRLARTLIQHSYQQAFVETTYYNPFITGYQWISELIHDRTCDVCRQRHLEIFDKDSLPLDHPMGLCNVIAVIPDSLQNIASKIGDWSNSPTGTYPDIDIWSKHMR
jgi:hypothetical protein